MYPTWFTCDSGWGRTVTCPLTLDTFTVSIFDLGEDAAPIIGRGDLYFEWKPRPVGCFGDSPPIEY